MKGLSWLKVLCVVAWRTSADFKLLVMGTDLLYRTGRSGTNQNFANTFTKKTRIYSKSNLKIECELISWTVELLIIQLMNISTQKTILSEVFEISPFFRKKFLVLLVKTIRCQSIVLTSQNELSLSCIRGHFDVSFVSEKNCSLRRGKSVLKTSITFKG